MPRKSVSETRINCFTSKNLTKGIKPKIIEKVSGNRYHICTKCLVCNKIKNK